MKQLGHAGYTLADYLKQRERWERVRFWLIVWGAIIAVISAVTLTVASVRVLLGVVFGCGGGMIPTIVMHSLRS